MCASCQYRKGHKHNTGTHTLIQDPLKERQIHKNKLYVRELVSINHFIVKEMGQRLGSQEKEENDQMYQGGTIFVDAASGQIQVKFQIGLSAAETI
jgi:hypothetical protein